MNLAKEKNIIFNEDINKLKNTVTEKLNWQNERLKSFENEFFASKCTGNGAAVLKTLPVVMFVLIYIARWITF